MSTSTTPETQSPSEPGYGLLITDGPRWWRASDSRAALVFATPDEAQAWHMRNPDHHAVVTPFDWALEPGYGS